MLPRIAVLLAIGAAAGCKGTPANEATAGPTPMVPTAGYSRQQPTYLAADYGKAGEPLLTTSQLRLIRKTLAVIKPCQRELLRYAFPEVHDAQTQMVLFFADPSGPIGEEHILWQGNALYNENNVIAAPDPIASDIHNDIAHTPCLGTPKRAAMRMVFGTGQPTPSAVGLSWPTRYRMHMITFPLGWSTPQVNAPLFGRATDATIGRNGTVAIIAADMSNFFLNPSRPWSRIQNVPQGVLILRRDGTKRFLHASSALEMQPFPFHWDPAACLRDPETRPWDCAHFANIALAHDGTPFATLEQPFYEPRQGNFKAGVVWNGAWHVIRQGSPFDDAGDPYTPRNLTIAAADSVLDYAYNGDYADDTSYDQSYHWLSPTYHDIAAVHLGSRIIQLGTGDVLGMRGRYIVGTDIGYGTTGAEASRHMAILWQCSRSASASRRCMRTKLGSGVAYAVDPVGEAVGSDQWFDMRTETFEGFGFPLLWRDGKSIRLSERHGGAALGIAIDGVIVGAFENPGAGPDGGFVASARDPHPHAVPLDPLVRNLGSLHVWAALGVADDGRVLAVVGSEKVPWYRSKLAILQPQ